MSHPLGERKSDKLVGTTIGDYQRMKQDRCVFMAKERFVRKCRRDIRCLRSTPLLKSGFLPILLFNLLEVFARVVEIS
jgi:hypothetical protein